ncbi:alpha/beta hydrolase [Tomitella fengzijianii]|uniref:Alpha/beta hydrolase n=1 Tax=Tomitella fengzijianii TaxID=2597660 RepID=A0A516X196_9ACTN|nr:alpha/beta hydrolase [Tomitella fengzijianii]QDQ96856.1 alpha/beta hydrolase [Tomitella fengzijianii]
MDPATATRRGFLAGALGAGAALGLAACGSNAAGGTAPAAAGPIAPPTTLTPPPPGPPGPGATPLPPFRLFADESMNFDALFGLGESAYGISEAGEVVTAVNQANAAGAGYDGYVTAFRAMGDRLAAASDAATAAGDRVTARDTALRAASYYTRAVFFVLGTADPGDEKALYAEYRKGWDRGVSGAGLAIGSRPAAEIVQIPYGDGGLTGWLFRPDDSGTARRTVIVNNGSDAQGVELIAYGVRAALDRDWNALVFEGPGQGAMLFERGIPFRPDWEKVITPIVDLLSGRDDVAANAIALTGWSMGGELVARAAAYEHRLAALVADPPAVDMWRTLPDQVRQIVDPDDPERTNTIWNEHMVPGMSPEQRFTVAKRMEIYTPEAHRAALAGHPTRDFAAVAARMKKFTVAEDTPRIRCPTLVLDYEGESFYPGQPEEFLSLLTVDDKTLVTLTAADGAQYHCAPMAPARRNEVVFDWLDDAVPG